MSSASPSVLLPDPRRRGEIQFELAKSLPYNRRMMIIAALLAAGFILQAAVGLLVGAVPLLAAALLAVVKGFSNVPEGFAGPTEWRGATRKQLQSVLAIARNSRQWHSSALDVSCGPGLLTFGAAIAVGSLVTLCLADVGDGRAAWVWALDAAVLLLPHWVTGVRRILTNDPLTVKAEQFLMVMDLWERNRQEGEAAVPQMLIRRGPKGEMPCDAKLVVRFEKLGEAFLGLQVQVNLNRVQGSDYPYLYCVLVARDSLRMLDILKPHPPKGIVAEPERRPAEHMEILVIRRKTTKTSGYHTDKAACRSIFLFALDQCRRLEAAEPKTQGA